MIVWGGWNGTDFYLNTGGRYNPSSDSWTATNTTNAPAARSDHTAVWTGIEMIVWGGEPTGVSNTGGRYDPSSDSWTATSTTNAPGWRVNYTAVWTGSEMIVWGGLGAGGDLNTGGRYNPRTDNSTATTTIGAPVPRAAHTAVWTGSEMIVWGGNQNVLYLNTGGRYNPVTNSWTATSTTNAPTDRTAHTAVWTGSEMIVWGGLGNGGTLNTGGRYCTAVPTGTPTPTPTPTPTSTPGPCGSIQQIAGSIVPGTADTGNHCSGCVTTVPLPFPYLGCGTTYTSINVSSAGTAQFTTADPNFGNICLPWLDHDCTIFLYWDDLRTDNLGWPGCGEYPTSTCGIFTSVSGTAPNRIFNIEWRAVHFGKVGPPANFELRLYEGQTRFDVIYGTVGNGNISATAGFQSDNTCFAQYFCNGSGGPPTGGWTNAPAGSPTPTPTATATATTTATATPTATATVTPTPTPTIPPRPTPTPRAELTPRPRPTPVPGP
jgi:hypothetical protein